MCARLVKKIWCDYIIDCSCYSEENKNRHNFLCATAWITIVAKSDVWIAITFSLLMQMPRFTYHFNSFNLLFKAVPNLVQNIAFEKNIPVPNLNFYSDQGINIISSLRNGNWVTASDKHTLPHAFIHIRYNILFRCMK